VLWTGDGNSGRSITGVGFQPDFVWIKDRTRNERHILIDSNRGSGNILTTIDDRVENTNRFDMLSSFDSDGFTIGNAGPANFATDNFVAWCWKAGGPAVTNTDGSITSQVSVNQDAGFSIVSWTANTSSPNTIGHGLSKIPKFIIAKRRNEISDWPVYHSSLPATDYIGLNLTNGKATNSAVWNNTSPTSSVFTVGSIFDQNETVIAYCWAEIEGFSKFGSYVGNGSTDGPFVYCGFKPAFVILKSSSAADNWRMYDSSRGSTNGISPVLYPNLTLVESTPTHIDFLSNGFKLRSDNSNASGVTHIFIAFAESPFQYANSK
jgi:hypothetical protein